MNLQKKHIKIILYIGLLFLFIALSILFGIRANEFHQRILYHSDDASYWVRYPNELLIKRTRCTAIAFLDIFAILLSIYWITKIVSSFLEINNIKININIQLLTNLFKIILYSGLFFLYLALAVWFGMWTNQIHIGLSKLSGLVTIWWLKPLYVAFIFIDISVVLLSIYQISKIAIFLPIKNVKE